MGVAASGVRTGGDIPVQHPGDDHTAAERGFFVDLAGRGVRGAAQNCQAGFRVCFAFGLFRGDGMRQGVCLVAVLRPERKTTYLLYVTATEAVKQVFLRKRRGVRRRKAPLHE